MLASLTAFLVLGCSGDQVTRVTHNIKSISVNPANAKQLPLSEICDSVSYVLLDTPEELAIGQIDRVLLSNNTFFVLDREIASALYVFDRKGKYLFDIQEGIGGPGEVLEFTDFDVSKQNEELYILDNERMDIKVFDFSGAFVRSIRLPFFAAALNVLDDEIAVFRNNQYNEADEWGNHQVVVVSKEGAILRSFLPLSLETNYFSYHDSFRPLQTTDAGWIFSQALNDSIYEISGNTLTGKYKIDFGDRSLSQIEGGFFGINDFLQSEQRMKSYYLMGDTFETSDYLMALFFAGKTYQYLFYDKQTGQPQVVSKIENDINAVPFMHIKFANDVLLLADLPAELLLMMDEQMPTAEKSNTIKQLLSDPVFEKENPILMLAYLKQRK